MLRWRIAYVAVDGEALDSKNRRIKHRIINSDTETSTRLGRISETSSPSYGCAIENDERTITCLHNAEEKIQMQKDRASVAGPLTHQIRSKTNRH